MIVSCDNSINNIYYNDHAIKKVYGCEGRLVWSGDTPSPTPHDYSQDYLTFTAKEKVYFGYHFVDVTTPLWFSINSGATWYKLDNDNIYHTPILNPGDKIMWRGTLSPDQGVGQDYGIGRFIPYNEDNVSGKGRFTAEGNVMSLMYYDDYEGKTSLSGQSYALYRLFSGNTELENAENLVLPATTLSTLCYAGMFTGCKSLTSAPTLPAPVLEVGCYQNMFHNCINLNRVKCLATDISAYGCTNYWLDNVPQTGTFVKASSMNNWTSGSSGIPSGWTVVNT